ncbi:38696_t:CDS:1, partial [Gigaspora margarita]
DFKKTHDQKAHLKRKFKCKPKPIQILVQPSPLQNEVQEEAKDQ